ncbi:MAG: bacillithiol biosynthesis cysteine-adding enzyme BshC [Acidobacteria bacterium]|nr:MAG: bacillithiol biosynthesis cysteine-adding enzyme BshC [Acidobacteriota bacterium]PYQ89302.1 MAG: bacillithiol biosynthesis cysteine-adding enzyme BshC [Acidobacteriota bacterium]
MVRVNSSSVTDESSVRIPVDVRRFPWIRRLAADYAYDFGAVAPFFSGDPSDRTAWADAIARSQAYERRRADIAAVIAGQQQRRNAPPRAREAGRLLADSRTVAIVTGQQAGLFGGPLFTLLKALTALKLANQVSRDHSVPVVAIFWIDAEDHDWEEIRSCTVFDADLTSRTVSLPPRPGAEPAPVATIKLDDAVVGVLDETERVLPPTAFREDLLAELRRSYAPGTGMADAFGQWLEQVLGGRGLVVYDSSDARSKPLVSSVFARELSMPGQTVKLASLAGSDLIARGYHAQVHPQDDSAALFRIEGGRRAIRRQDGQFIVGDERFPTDALLRQATERPTGFSPNVLLRPVVQDTIFPTICYVAGPNELAYLGQLRGVYQHFGVPMPLMYPRASATLLDSAAVRFLTKYKLPLEALQAQDEAALNELLRAQIPPVVEESFTVASQTIEQQMTRLVEAIPALDPTLEGAARSTLARMQHDLQTLHGKMIQAAKRRDETLRRQFIRARALAFPGGHAQERTIGFVSFLNQYGPALVERLDGELPLDLGRHWIVTI